MISRSIVKNGRMKLICVVAIDTYKIFIIIKEYCYLFVKEKVEKYSKENGEKHSKENGGKHSKEKGENCL